MQVPTKDRDVGMEPQYRTGKYIELEALTNYLQWYDLRAPCPKLIISQLVYVVLISGDLLMVTKQEKEKSECSWKGLNSSSL